MLDQEQEEIGKEAVDKHEQHRLAKYLQECRLTKLDVYLDLNRSQCLDKLFPALIESQMDLQQIMQCNFLDKLAIN